MLPAKVQHWCFMVQSLDWRKSRENGAVGFIPVLWRINQHGGGKGARAGPLALESTPAAGNRQRWQGRYSRKDDGSRAVRPNR